jgi:hypothetical protein
VRRTNGATIAPELGVLHREGVAAAQHPIRVVVDVAVANGDVPVVALDDADRGLVALVTVGPGELEVVCNESRGRCLDSPDGLTATERVNSPGRDGEFRPPWADSNESEIRFRP